ncbi:Endo-beta-1 6-galactanase [Orbilia ellipsospora]|uniref:Endo-beta-1 6-galactanase n=1 Tax=Orbilia ellipsospora TaxID=2528407 RepID=A0AAV9XMY5_9PEZI
MFYSIAAALLLISGQLVLGDYIINPSTNWGVWQGWGTSLAWWAKAFGTRTDLSKIFFTTATTSYNGVSVPGLGLNIVRYNAGACSTNTYSGTSMVKSPNIKPARQMDGFWLNWASTDPTTSSWNWNVDANQRAALTNAKSNGANHFILFSNSPMWWMLYNKNPSGGANGTENIQSWNYQDHATYLATIAKHAQSSWGITFESVEAFNEPSSNWWTSTGTQEGCKIGASTQAQIIPYLRTALNNQGLSSTMIAASDENTIDIAISTWNALSSTAKSSVNQIHVHGYQGGGGDRVTLYNTALSQGKKLWNSEYGDSDSTGVSLASNLILDFRWLHPTAWVYWQVIDVPGWGLLEGNIDAGTLASFAQKYYVLAHFTRHIREGMTIIDGGGDVVVSAYDSVNHKLIIVAVNWSTTSQYLNFDLSKFGGVVNGATVPRWATSMTSGGSRYVSYPSDTVISGTRFWSNFGPNTIMTFEISGVTH